MDYISIFTTMGQEISLIIAFILVFIIDLFLPEDKKHHLGTISSILLAISIIINIMPCQGELFGGMYTTSPLANALKTILSAGTLIIFLQSTDWLSKGETAQRRGEFYVLTFSTLIGLFYMISAGNFLMLFIGMELATIPVACLVAFDKYKGHSAEAGAKFILSALFSSGLMLYGISMLYGSTGTLYFNDIPSLLVASPLEILSLVFFFSGLAFKLSLVPFHLWTADTYQGAPTSVTAYLSVISKGAAAFVLMTVFMKAFAQCDLMYAWNTALYWLIVASITVANLFAIRQDNIKRFMAFSAISQAGYLVLAVMD